MGGELCQEKPGLGSRCFCYPRSEPFFVQWLLSHACLVIH